MTLPVVTRTDRLHNDLAEARLTIDRAQHRLLRLQIAAANVVAAAYGQPLHLLRDRIQLLEAILHE